jgi:hypothetical protein
MRPKKLTIEQMITILERKEAGETIVQLAKDYEVSYNTIKNVIKGMKREEGGSGGELPGAMSSGFRLSQFEVTFSFHNAFRSTIILAKTEKDVLNSFVEKFPLAKIITVSPVYSTSRKYVQRLKRCKEL